MSDIAYLDSAAASPAGQEYKARLLEALQLGSGQVVLDIGCGPATDLAAMAERTGPAGRVIGMDRDPAMAGEAAGRCAGDRRVEILAGDAHALPLAAGIVDRVRVDRVLQHVENPAGVLAEIRRVLRPGGLVVIGEPDWDSLLIDDPDLEISRGYTRFVVRDVVRNSAVGRQLGRLAVEVGFTLRTLDAMAVVFRDAAAAERILRMTSVAGRAVTARQLPAAATKRWLDRIGTAEPFLAAFTFFMIVAESAPMPFASI